MEPDPKRQRTSAATPEEEEIERRVTHNIELKQWYEKHSKVSEDGGWWLEQHAGILFVCVKYVYV